MRRLVILTGIMVSPEHKPIWYSLPKLSNCQRWTFAGCPLHTRCCVALRICWIGCCDVPSAPTNSEGSHSVRLFENLKNSSKSRSIKPCTILKQSVRSAVSLRCSRLWISLILKEKCVQNSVLWLVSRLVPWWNWVFRPQRSILYILWLRYAAMENLGTSYIVGTLSSTFPFTSFNFHIVSFHFFYLFDKIKIIITYFTPFTFIYESFHVILCIPSYYRLCIFHSIQYLWIWQVRVAGCPESTCCAV